MSTFMKYLKGFLGFLQQLARPVVGLHSVITNKRCWDVANSKRHQRATTEQNLDFFYPHYIQEISKVVCKKSLSCNMPMQSPAKFPGCASKKNSRFRPVVGGVLN